MNVYWTILMTNLTRLGRCFIGFWRIQYGRHCIINYFQTGDDRPSDVDDMNNTTGPIPIYSLTDVWFGSRLIFLYFGLNIFSICDMGYFCRDFWDHTHESMELHREFGGLFSCTAISDYVAQIGEWSSRRR